MLLLLGLDIAATVRVHEHRSDTGGVYHPFAHGLSELNTNVNQDNAKIWPVSNADDDRESKSDEEGMFALSSAGFLLMIGL